jgi:ribosomal protein S27AE
MSLGKLAEEFFKLSQKVDVAVGKARIDPSIDIGQAVVGVSPSCPRCAEGMYYDTASKSFKCAHCGYAE